VITFELVGDKELVARLDGIPTKVRAALEKKITALSLTLATKIKDDKLSGQDLNVVTGSLRRSITARVPPEVTEDSIVGGAYSSGDVKYAAIHEFGGQISIPDIFPVKAQALHFVVDGKDVFAKRVRAHTVNMPERSFMRSTLAEMRAEIIAGIREGYLEGLSK
jgi:phage gpG-like protein